MMNAPVAVSAIKDERKALHNALLEMGFVYAAEKRKYFYHQSDEDVGLILEESACSSFDQAIRNLGSRFFSSMYVGEPELRKLSYLKSQELIGHADMYMNIQIANILRQKS